MTPPGRTGTNEPPARTVCRARAVGPTRSQVRAVARRESVVLGVLGALTGVGLGTVVVDVLRAVTAE